MTGNEKVLYVLLVEDDKDNLKLLMESLPRELEGHIIKWDPCEDFKLAQSRLSLQRYDLVVTDVYRDRLDRGKGVNSEDESARDIVSMIRGYRFCPIVAFSDGSKPKSFAEGPFVRFADKSAGNGPILSELSSLIKTGMPWIAHKLHEELDRNNGSYLWSFLESNWERLRSRGELPPAVLERLLRRRAAMQLGRIETDGDVPLETEIVEGLEYYIYPAVSSSLRLGEIIKRKADGEIRVILTPHCHMTIQPEDGHPRAEYVLTVKTVGAKEAVEKATTPKSPWSGDEVEKIDKLRRRTAMQAKLGRPSGRYCFLPGFLDLPDCFCDLLQLESISFQSATSDFDRIAVLDSPFAEALQSNFTRFYATVGLPTLNIESLRHLIGPVADSK